VVAVKSIRSAAGSGSLAYCAENMVVTIPKGIIPPNEIQDFLDYLRYRELVSQSKATETEIEELCEEINDGIAKRNTERNPK